MAARIMSGARADGVRHREQRGVLLLRRCQTERARCGSRFPNARHRCGEIGFAGVKLKLRAHGPRLYVQDGCGQDSRRVSAHVLRARHPNPRRASTISSRWIISARPDSRGWPRCRATSGRGSGRRRRRHRRRARARSRALRPADRPRHRRARTRPRCGHAGRQQALARAQRPHRAGIEMQRALRLERAGDPVSCAT